MEYIVIKFLAQRISLMYISDWNKTAILIITISFHTHEMYNIVTSIKNLLQFHFLSKKKIYNGFLNYKILNYKITKYKKNLI